MNTKFVQNWIETVDYQELKRKISDRELYIWGAYEDAAYISDWLLKQGTDTCGFIESNKELAVYHGISAYKPEHLCAPLKQFVIIPVGKNINSIIHYLHRKDFVQDRDYIILKKEYSVLYSGGQYQDNSGNQICSLYQESSDTIRVWFKGYHNTVTLGENVKAQNVIIKCGYGGQVTIGDNCILKNTLIIAGQKSSVFIGNACSFGDGCKIRSYGSIEIGAACSVGENTELLAYDKIVIGKKSSIVKDGFIFADNASPVEIGEDCMMSWPVHIRSNNSHAIIDLENKMNLCTEKVHFVKIGNHVWLGENVTILGGSRLEEGSIIGAGSLVNKEFQEKNVIIAGVPAKIVKEHCTWDRNFHIRYEEFVSKDDCQQSCVGQVNLESRGIQS